MIQGNIVEVERKIMAACNRAGRNRDEITLIAVSKTKPISMIKEAIESGLTNFGENKVQELCEKTEQIKGDLHWHMIGHLQRNKVKYIIEKNLLIHSVDSIKLAEQINTEASKRNLTQDILVEVNIASEESKYGFKPEEVEAAIYEMSKFSSLSIKGLMCVAPFTENAEENRIYFKKMRQLLVDIKEKNIDNVTMDMLSMGMSGDYEVAIEEGATLVRIGTGIFGERNYNV
ncbi:YggS family pyridoxal phosphate-dependent enzyme [Clostridium sp. Marseille-P299]|uniref:YggS family pyridoxal phosphate-dependent enzyme n=1 Tax=Clostridium sp. Marseille-P299 TaxID=1805477 RepID=UPI00082BF54E|nr:YggS family pyridoxal phosphate-dependent enzyme [Clostridium sp. Marseille-P299]